MALSVVIVAIPTVSSCKSPPDPTTTDLSPAQIFQRAIEASDRSEYRLALKYYTVFKEKYPEDLERSLWADYEIAFCHYKMGDEKKAIELFDALIARYGTEEGKNFPQAPRILAEKIRQKIQEKKKPAEEPAAS